MDRSGPPPVIDKVFFGNDDAHLFLRADFGSERRAELAPHAELRVVFTAPRALVVVCPFAAHRRMPAADCRWALDHVLEIAVPLASLGLSAGSDCAFHIELRGPGLKATGAAEPLEDGAEVPEAVERAPHEGEIRFAALGPDEESS
jgi:hypothetical protein